MGVLEDAPIGTRAPALGGGFWVKEEGGWRWPGGGLFPSPGGDWVQWLIEPTGSTKERS